MNKKIIQSSEWDLCPKCKRPWKYHVKVILPPPKVDLELHCPKILKPFSWRTKKNGSTAIKHNGCGSINCRNHSSDIHLPPSNPGEIVIKAG